MITLDKTLILQMVNFLILLWILNRFLYKPILNILEERKRKIQAAEKDVQELGERTSRQWEQYQRQLQEAKASANAEKERLKAEGGEAERRVLEAARAEAARSLEEARRMIQEESVRARELLRVQAEGIAAEMAHKVLGRGLQS